MEPYTKISKSVAYKRLYEDILYYNGIKSHALVDSGTFSSSNTLNGYRNPWWKSLLVKHQAGTPMVADSSFVDYGYVEYGYERYNTSQKRIESYHSYSGANSQVVAIAGSVPSVPAVLKQRALTLFYNSIDSKLSEFKGLTFIGEAREAFHMLKHPFQSLRDLAVKREERLWRSFKRVRQFTPGAPRKRLLRDFKNAAADTWLETSYGVQPLASDIEAIARHLQDRQALLRIEYFPVKGRAVDFTASTVKDGVLYNTLSMGHPVEKRTETKLSWQFKGQLRMDPLREEFSSAEFNKLGFGLREFVPTLYELTPWSFLIDYWTNLSTIISSITLPLRDLMWIVETIRSNVASEWIPSRRTSVQHNVGFDVTSTSFNVLRAGYAYKRSVVRNIYTPFTLPSPEFYFEVPNVGQVANMLALALSNSRSRFSTIA